MHTLSTRPPLATVARSSASSGSGQLARTRRSSLGAGTTTRSALRSRSSSAQEPTVKPTSDRIGPGSPATTANS